MLGNMVDAFREEDNIPSAIDCGCWVIGSSAYGIAAAEISLIVKNDRVVRLQHA